MENIEYNKKVLDHFRHPRNMGEIKNADGIGKVGNPVCGDLMTITIKVDERRKNPKGPLRGGDESGKKEKYIKDIKFKTLGCGAAIATASMATTLVKGKSITEAKKISNQEIAKSLGGLPAVKMHCSMLAMDVVKQAIEDYERRGHTDHHG